jgi:hypothetical protein
MVGDVSMVALADWIVRTCERGGFPLPSAITLTRPDGACVHVFGLPEAS